MIELSTLVQFAHDGHRNAPLTYAEHIAVSALAVTGLLARDAVASGWGNTTYKVTDKGRAVVAAVSSIMTAAMEDGRAQPSRNAYKIPAEPPNHAATHAELLAAACGVCDAILHAAYPDEIMRSCSIRVNRYERRWECEWYVGYQMPSRVCTGGALHELIAALEADSRGEHE